MRTQGSARAAVVAVVIGATVGAPAVAAGEVVLRRDGSKAVDYVPAPSAPTTSPHRADGFQLDDAGLGAAGMLVLALATAGAVSLRGRRRHDVVTRQATR